MNDLDCYTVLYHSVDALPEDKPETFICHAEDKNHAIEQCCNAYPDCKVIFARKKRLIKCFSNVTGFEIASEMVNDLNKLKSKLSESFFLENSDNNFYTIIGNVTKEDWDNLSLEDDFMKIG